MNFPPSITRLLGTPRVAAALYVGCTVAILGWLGGEVPWWLGLAALCFAGTVHKAVQDMRRYNRWRTAWDSMGNPASVPAAKPPTRKRKAPLPWTGVIVAALSLVIIPMVMRTPGADEGLRNVLTLLWLGVAGYLLWKLAMRVRRVPLPRGSGTHRAGESRKSTTVDVVQWVLPRASSCPSRADAVRRVPAYCAQVMAS